MSASRTAPVYIVASSETPIDATIAQTWPFLVDYPSWQNYTTVETIEGTPGEAGEVVRLKKEDGGFVFPTYYARTILVEPERKIIWKTFLDEDTPEIQRFGIVEFRLFERDGQTIFWSNLIYEFTVPYETDQDLRDFEAMQNENFRTLQATTRPRLKKLVEESVAQG